MIAYPVSLAESSAGQSSIVTAVVWLQDVLLGTVATSIAVVAIAAIGFGMLTGRVDIRRGVTVVMGCFVLFGASSIVAGLRSATGGGYAESVVSDPPPVVSGPMPVPSSTPPAPFDPYAGASVPQR